MGNLIGIAGNLLRWVGGFIGGIFATKTGVVGNDGFPKWFLLISVFVGYLIFKEFNK